MLFFKKAQLERQLMNEIKSYAGVTEFPAKDAQILANTISAYGRGNAFISLAMYSAYDVIEKYPNLYNNWDDIMMKYKKLGLFPKWEVWGM